jgi:hypothetical protein
MIYPRYLLLATALLAACGAEPSADAGGSPAADSAASAASAEQGTVDTLPSDSAPDRGTPVVVLAPDGLDVTGGGAPKRLAFGGAQASVLTDVGAVLGQPREQGMQEECPAGPLYHMSFAEGLELQFQDGAFVGWFARQGSTLRTARGVGPGSTLSQLKAAYPATTVEETSLGSEFAADSLYGVLANPSDAGEVEVMFAGINCIFR